MMTSRTYRVLRDPDRDWYVVVPEHAIVTTYAADEDGRMAAEKQVAELEADE